MGKHGALAVVLSALLSGCLVTSEIDFQVEENVPPLVLDKPGEEGTIGSVLWVDIDDTNWELLVDVRDENIGQPVTARWRVQTEEQDEPEFKQAELAPSGTARRELRITLDQGDLVAGECHRLQLVVSSSFVEGSTPNRFDITSPVEDIGRANWWLWEGMGEASADPDEALRLINSCRTSILEGSQTVVP